MRIDFFPDGSPELGGAASVEHSVSYTKSTASGLIRYSTAMAKDAAAILAMAYHRPEAERSKIDVIHEGQGALEYVPDLDSIVYLGLDETVPSMENGEKNAWAAVSSIENGHWSSPGRPWGEGPRRKRLKPSEKRSWVPGVAPLGKAMKKATRNPRLSIR
jgi:hypothetical protein